MRISTGYRSAKFFGAMSRILAFGSSTAYGMHDYEGGGWVNRVKITYAKRADKKNEREVLVHNFAIPGQTLYATLDEVHRQTDRYRHCRSQLIGVFMIGEFDHSRDVQTKQPINSFEQFCGNLNRLGNICIVQGVQPVFVGAPSVGGGRKLTRRSPQIFDPEDRREYQDAVREHAIKVDAPFVELAQAFADTHGGTAGGLLSEDKVHPNAAGHQFIHDQVVPVLDAILNARRDVV